VGSTILVGGLDVVDGWIVNDSVGVALVDGGGTEGALVSTGRPVAGAANAGGFDGRFSATNRSKLDGGGQGSEDVKDAEMLHTMECSIHDCSVPSSSDHSRLV
jgi:hypothetical protein